MKTEGKPAFSIPLQTPEDFHKLHAEKEAFLSTLSPAERAVVNGHSVSFCTLDGRYFPFEGEKEDLFDVIACMERYVADTNSN